MDTRTLEAFLRELPYMPPTRTIGENLDTYLARYNADAAIDR